MRGPSSLWAVSDAAEMTVGDDCNHADAEESAPMREEVSDESVNELLRASGGRMASTLLIARFEPLDAAGRRALAGIVQRLCRTVLPASGGGGASIVLRETLATEMAEARAVTLVQRRERRRRAGLRQATTAAISLQTAARRWLGSMEVSALRRQQRAAVTLQDAARRRCYVRELRRARMELRAAFTLQMLARRWLLRLRIGLRFEVSEAAALRMQCARRRQISVCVSQTLRREALLAKETPEERDVRKERERTAALRQKLQRRRRQEQRHRGQQQQPRSQAASVPVALLSAAPQPGELPTAAADDLHADGELGAEKVAAAAVADLDALLARLSDPALSVVDTLPDDDEARQSPATRTLPPGESELGSELEGEGEDFLAAMRTMMAVHGGEDASDDED
jgi:hypothetical protein